MRDCASQHLRRVAALAGVHRTHPSKPESWGHLRLIETIGLGNSGILPRWDTRLDVRRAELCRPIARRVGGLAIHPRGHCSPRAPPNVATSMSPRLAIGSASGWHSYAANLEQFSIKDVFTATEAARMFAICAAPVGRACPGCCTAISRRTRVIADDGRWAAYSGRRALDDSSPIRSAERRCMGAELPTASGTAQNRSIAWRTAHHIVTGSYPVSGRPSGYIKTRPDRTSYRRSTKRPMASGLRTTIERASYPSRTSLLEHDGSPGTDRPPTSAGHRSVSPVGRVSRLFSSSPLPSRVWPRACHRRAAVQEPGEHTRGHLSAAWRPTHPALATSGLR